MWSRTNGRCLTEGIEDPKWGAEVRRAQSLGEVGTAAQRSQSRKKGMTAAGKRLNADTDPNMTQTSTPWRLNAQALITSVALW